MTTRDSTKASLDDFRLFFNSNLSATREYDRVCDRRNRQNAITFLIIVLVSQVFVGGGRVLFDLGFPFYNIAMMVTGALLIVALRKLPMERIIRRLIMGLFALWAVTFPFFIVRLGGYESPTYPVYILIVIYIFAFFYLSFRQYLLLYCIIFFSNVAIVFLQPDVDWVGFIFRQALMSLVVGVVTVASYLQVEARRRDFYNQYCLREQKLMLEKAYQKLEQAELQLVQQEKLASLGKMTAGMAHEVNNPLGFIHGNLEMMKADIERIDEVMKAGPSDGQTSGIQETIQDLRDSIEGCTHGVDRIRSVVDGLKHFSRLDEAEKKSVDVAQCLDQTLAMFHDLASVKIKRDYRPAINIEGYPALLGQLFYAVIENAIDAMSELPAKELSLEVTMAGDLVRVCISDNGPGIPEEIRAKIFDPFFTTKAVGKGTGLGLSVAFGIAAQHGGDIRVETSRLGGAAFVIELAKKPDEKSRQTPID